MSELITTVDVFGLAKDLQMAAIDLPFDKRFEHIKSALSMLGVSTAVGQTFFVECEAAFLVETRNRRSSVDMLPGLVFEGKLDTFSYIHTGMLGTVPIKGMCATFTDVELLPDRDRVVSGTQLHVPAVAMGMALQAAA